MKFLKREFAGKVTGCLVVGFDFDQLRLFGFAPVLDEGTAQVEFTAGRRVGRVGYIAFQGDALPGVVRVDQGDGRKQCGGVGMEGLFVEALGSGDFDDLAEACAQRNRWEFMFFIGALRLHNTTGSPVNPIAVL